METNSPLFGHFTIQGAEHAGLLTLDGSKSRLDIYSEAELTFIPAEMRHIQGISKDGMRITAINCIGSSAGGATYYGETRHFLSVFPNYVVLGARHLEPDRAEISSLSFTFSNAIRLFYDWGTFGRLLKPGELPFQFARQMLKAVKHAPKDRRRGGTLDLFYNWDRGPIVKVVTERGTIMVFNSTTTKFPSPSGIRVENEVRVEIQFPGAVTLDQAIPVLFVLQSFIELVSQSKQNIEKIALVHKDGSLETPLELHLPNEEAEPIDELRPTDALINGGLCPTEFETTLKAWLTDDADLRSARRRFLEGFRDGRHYTTDRLVGAANAFDLLPTRCFPSPKPLAGGVETLLAGLRNQVQEASAEDPNVCDHREQFLNALGRIGGLNLRNKILMRYASIDSALKAGLSNMEGLIRRCVLARNYFVHGSDPGISPEATYDLAPFFTDTLEFIFAVSDLQSCGWNTGRWAKESYNRSRLKSYLETYANNVKRLRAAEAPSIC